MSAADARRIAETAARVSYGRLVALIARRTGDLAAAEDALAEAFHAALAQWPIRGVPESPDAWLLTVARRSHGRVARQAASAASVRPTLELIAGEEAAMPGSPFADKRLELMFICAHPAIDPAVHTPLMLQTVLGLDSARIAGAFLTAPATIGQRLVRAKAKIRDAGIAFEVPDPEAIDDRLTAVLDAIYVAYGTGWDDMVGTDPKRRGLADEAIYLAQLLVGQCPGQPEPRGLLAVLLYCEARHHARRAADGSFVPLAEHDIRHWSRPMIAEAEQQLRIAAEARRSGRFQTEAAIQSLHVEARITGRANSAALIGFYDLLALQTRAIGVLVARAAAYGARCAGEGLAMLDVLPAPVVGAYQPYWATRAHLEAAAGDVATARGSYRRAIGLTDDPAVRSFLARQCSALTGT